MPLITLQNVDFSVGGPLLLEKAELSIEPGERIALIGRNGAGKSTLLKLLSGDHKPDDGEVRVQQGVRVTRLEQEVPHGAAGSVFDVVADGLGELGQWLAEFHHLSHAEVFDGEALGNVQAKIDAANGWGLDQRVSETLTKLDLDGEAEFGRLSGGMKRRLMIARAMMTRPRLLILDEPTAGVDIEIRRDMWRVLKEINAAGTTIILTTHYLEEAEYLCRHLAIINHGQIVEQGPMRALLAKLDVEGFLLDIDGELPAQLPVIEGATLTAPDPHTLDIDMPRAMDLNRVFATLNEAGIRVRSMRTKSNRLEELFVRLTGNLETSA